MKRHLAIAIFSALFLGSISGLRSNAQTMPACPAEGTLTLANLGNAPYNGNCAATPTTYGLSFYEMGLCESNPMSSGSFDPKGANCTPTFESSGGEYHDIAGQSVTLGVDAGSRPENGEYSVAYVIIGNIFTLNGSYAFDNGAGGTTTYYSNGSNFSEAVGNFKNTITSSSEFTDTLQSFAGSNSCDADWAEPQSNGTLNAYITDQTLSTSSTCTGSTRIVGALLLNSPIRIDDSVTGLQVDFSVTNNGMSILNQVQDGTPAAGSGPFSATFTLVR